MRFCCSEPKHYIAKAKTKQKVKATYKRVEALTKQMSKAVSIDLAKGITTFKKKIKPQMIRDAFESKNYSEIMNTVPWDDFNDHMEPFHNSLASAALKATSLTIPSIPAPKNSALRYDMKNPSLNRYVHNRSGELIVNIKQESQAHVQAIIERSFTQAMTPDRVADEIRSSIGLLPRQEQALRNYKTSLREQGMNPDRISVLGDQYAERLLTSRCMTIARTETRRATNFGQLQVWNEGANLGYIDKTKAKKIWIVDGNPCELCEPMDGIGVPLDGVWTLDNGTVCDLPSDSHPNCLCGMELDFGDTEED